MSRNCWVALISLLLLSFPVATRADTALADANVDWSFEERVSHCTDNDDDTEKNYERGDERTSSSCGFLWRAFLNERGHKLLLPRGHLLLNVVLVPLLLLAAFHPRTAGSAEFRIGRPFFPAIGAVAAPARSRASLAGRRNRT